jgi:hypothetical protein
MAKRALCVGINDYPQRGQDLTGCVNDANAWATLLTEHYDFPRADIEVVLDRDATHDAIVAGLERLLTKTRAGDVLVFTNSSHGTYIKDTDSDEAVYDEAICPYDVDEKPLVDDELRTIFAELKRGVRLTVISDSCFSGSVTRAAEGPLTPDHRRVRFMNPKNIGRAEIPDVRRAARPKRPDVYPESSMKEVLLTGCNHKQYSFDATIDGTPHGAFSYYALAAIRDARYRITYEDLHAQAVAALAMSNYDQEPQLEGKRTNKRRQIFT